MKIALLTSSRADYSIYLPLLRKIEKEDSMSVDIVAFGTHLSKKHGYTISNILADGFAVKYRIPTVAAGDSPKDIADSMGKSISKISSIWSKEQYDLIICLGDRYEMFAAVSSAVPFSIPIAHIHGGETTMGAIDNVFRHSITMMSKFHFSCAKPYQKKITQLLGTSENVYNVGALSIDNLKALKLLTKAEFLKKFAIDLSPMTALVTFHPETVAYKKNEYYIDELIAALQKLKGYQVVFTMPNADTSGIIIRDKISRFVKGSSQAVSVESFGTIGYLSCMKHCSLLIGNSSSGFTEASFFRKSVVNIGNRQLGRILTPNITTCSIDRKEIIAAVKGIEQRPAKKFKAVYGNGTAADKIVDILRSI